MTPLRQRKIDDMRLRNLSLNTQHCYRITHDHDFANQSLESVYSVPRLVGFSEHDFTLGLMDVPSLVTDVVKVVAPGIVVAVCDHRPTSDPAVSHREMVGKERSSLFKPH